MYDYHTMGNLNAEQKLYLSFLIAGCIVVLLLAFYLFYKNYLVKKKLKFFAGYILYRYSNLNDYLLLNDYKIHIDEKHIGEIDHILITNKFIVVINDFSISGVLTGRYNDEQIKLTNNKETKLIANPLNYNRNLTKRLALFNDLDNSFLKGITVINDDSLVEIDEMLEQFKICRKKDLKKVIRQFEKEDVKPFKEDTVVNFINILNENNLSGNKK